MNAHDDMLDNVAAYALGTLDTDEARAVVAHMRTCEECCAEYDALRPVASAVGFAGENEAAPSPLLKARIMKQVRAQSMVPATRGSFMLPYALAAACLLIAAGLGAVVVEQHATIAGLSTARSVAFAQGDVLVAPDRLIVVVHDLPALPPGKVYQTWTLAKGATAMTPQATFTPDEHGSAVVAIPADTSSTVATAISVEPAGGSQEPTTKPVAVIKLGA